MAFFFTITSKKKNIAQFFYFFSSNFFFSYFSIGLKKNTCKICNKSYKQKKNLIAHQQYSCQIKNQFKCSRCSNLYSHFKSLKAHLYKKHGIAKTKKRTFYMSNNLIQNVNKQTKKKEVAQNLIVFFFNLNFFFFQIL